MKKIVKNILFTCGGGSAPLYLADKLKNKYGIFLADASDIGIAPYLVYPFSKTSFGSDANFIKDIDRLVNKWKIDCLVPGADEELVKIRDYCDRKGILCISPTKKFIDLCLNKKKLMISLAENKISALLPFKSIKEIKYPVIAKPIYGRGSRQVHIVKNHQELKGYFNLYQKKFREVLIQPFISGDEYTVSVIVNNLNQASAIIPKKILIKKGITKAAVTKGNELIKQTCLDIIKKYEPRGPFNVQLMIFRDKIYIFEINPRLSTTAVLTDKSFGNEVDLYIKNYNKKIIIFNNNFKKNLYLFRSENNYFCHRNKLI